MESAQRKVSGYQTPVQEQRKKGISGSTIKIIAVVTMLIDHIAAGILTRMLIARGLLSLSNDFGQAMRWFMENGVLYYGMVAMRMAGRLGFPIFCFLLVEGFQKTKNIRKYILRLGLFALLSEVPFDLAFSGQVLEAGYQNVYFTLLFGILGLLAFDWFAGCEIGRVPRIVLSAAGILLLPCYGAMKICRLLSDWFLLPAGGAVFLIVYAVSLAAMLIFYVIYRNRRGSDRAWRVCADLAALTVAMLAADLLRTDYGGMGVLTIAFMYLFRRGKVRSMLAGCIVLSVMSLSEITAFLTLIPVAFYNGERGLKLKYFFYAFYPVHLLIIWLIAAAMGMGWMSAV